MTQDKAKLPAAQIMQGYLDDLSTAVLQGDWETYRRHVTLPFTLVTETATLVVDTEDSLRAGFDSFHSMLQFQRVTQYIRLVEAAVELGEGLISGRYTSHVIAGAHRIVPPFTSTTTLRLIGNVWCAVSITSAISNMQWPVSLIRVDAAMQGVGDKASGMAVPQSSDALSGRGDDEG
jgi:hypothetical protein